VTVYVDDRRQPSLAGRAVDGRSRAVPPQLRVLAYRGVDAGKE